jgi:hypothetical protein
MPRISEWLAEKGVPNGQWFAEAIGFTRTAARADDLSADALRVLLCLRLHTIRYRTELAVTMSNDKRRPFTPADLAVETGLTRQSVRRAMAELEITGYAERKPAGGSGLRKGNVQLWCWTLPRGTNRRPAPARPSYDLPPAPLSLVRRFRIRLPDDFVATDAYKAFVLSAAERYKQAELVAVRDLKEAFFVAPGAPPFKDVRNPLSEAAVRLEDSTPPPEVARAEPPSVGRSSASKADRPIEEVTSSLRPRIRAWLESNFALPVPLGDTELDQIAATIHTEQHFEQFQKAAQNVKQPRGWRVFVVIAQQCEKHHAAYAKAAAAGAGETHLDRKYREEVEKRRAGEISHG